MKRVFICSPYAGDVSGNARLAKRLCRIAVDHGYEPRAPHVYFTAFLDDNVPSERVFGLCFATDWLCECDEMWVCTEYGISAGMHAEIVAAHTWDVPIIYVDADGNPLPDVDPKEYEV